MTGHPRVFGDTFYLLPLFSLFLRFNSPLSLSLSLSLFFFLPLFLLLPVGD